LPLDNLDSAHEKTMLIRNRKSSIYFVNKFFDYPITLSLETLLNLGFIKVIKILMSYAKTRLFPIKDETYLDAFFINRFGKELYLTFFKSYTEKVWGVPCSQIKAEWGAQRIKGLSILTAIKHFLNSTFLKNNSLIQKNVETSLIDRFMYPKNGPGQMWQEVSKLVQEKGGEVKLRQKIVGIQTEDFRIKSVTIKNLDTAEVYQEQADYFISSMPISELVASLDDDVPKDVQLIGKGLKYRAFIVIGLLVNQLAIKAKDNGLILDNWIYIQDERVKLGRVQVFNNWSPYLVEDPTKVWLGLEYFCNEGDEMWSMADAGLTDFAIDEMVKIGFIQIEDVLDSIVIREPKAYPAYFGTYDQLGVIRKYIDNFDNLFLIGRNGMHKYNNQDHSMLTAMTVVDNITNGVLSKDNIWDVNTESEYHESKRK